MKNFEIKIESKTPTKQDLIITYDIVELSVILVSLLSFIVFWGKIINKKTLDILKKFILAFKQYLPKTADSTNIDDILLEIVEIGIKKIPDTDEKSIAILLNLLKNESIEKKKILIEKLISTDSCYISNMVKKVNANEKQ